MYLGMKGKNHLMMSLPAVFITAVCLTYLLAAPHSGGGLALPLRVAVITGVTGAVAAFILFLSVLKKNRIQQNQ